VARRARGIRLSAADAQKHGLIPAAKPSRTRKTHTADGHEINPAFTGYTEREFQRDVMDLARRGGWTCGQKGTDELHGLTYHAVSVMSQHEVGWPDLTLIRRRDQRLIFAELKRENGELSPRQVAVLDLLRCLTLPPVLHFEGLDAEAVAALGRSSLRTASIQVFVWRPSQIEQIAEVLR
jgi:hypothetical protein